MGLSPGAVQDTPPPNKEIEIIMRASPISHSKPSRLGAALSAARIRLAIGLTWFLFCAYLGSQLIVGSAVSHFSLISVSLPLLILLWVILYFCGRWLLSFLADAVSLQFATETAAETERNTQVPRENGPQVETARIVLRWAPLRDLPTHFHHQLDPRFGILSTPAFRSCWLRIG
jgi:hypothetical protein